MGLHVFRRWESAMLCALLTSTSACFAQNPTQSGTMSRKEEIHQVLYRIYKQQRKLDLAEKEVAAISALNPNNALIQQDFGRDLMQSGKYREALPHWQKATHSDPTNADYWACLGDCYMQLANYPAAGDPYSKAIRFMKAGGTDYRPRYQIYQQYMDHARQEKEYKKQMQKQKEESDE
ncbi:MAG TPA: tetratricopeptide repeat protein [Oculatellaceae cyanobacterium]